MTSLEGFFTQLRLLRVWAGDPSLRDLQRATGIARSTLAYALDPRRPAPPRLELVLAVVRACGGSTRDLESWRQAWRRVRTTADNRRTAEGPPPSALPEAQAPLAQPAQGLRPSQVPGRVGHFIGRGREFEVLLRALTEPAVPRPVLVLQGPAGIGKTALAAELTHAVTDRFSDGDVFLDLRGHDPATALSPSEALSRVLRSLGVGGQDIPEAADEQAALYRSLVSGRRLLLVLDNAGSTDQVLPLLPGTDSCAVVVTSRRALAALGTHHPAEIHTLAPLTPQDSLDLLARIIGDRRVIEDVASASELAELCDGFPLALRICAARLAAGDALTLNGLAHEVRHERRRLAAFTVEDDARSIRGTFLTAYRGLAEPTRRTFRSLGMHPATSFTTAAIAAMNGIPEPQAAADLRQLSAHHLVREISEQRYALHDLIALFARERARAEEPDQVRGESVERLANWQLAIAAAVNDAVSPQNQALTPATVALVPLPFGPAADATTQDSGARDAAMRFVDDEIDNLATVLDELNAYGHHTATAQIAYLLAGALDRSRPTQALAITLAGLRGAEAAEDLGAQRVLHAVFVAHSTNLRRPVEALDHALRAVVLVEQIASATPRARASTYNMLGRAHLQLRNYPEAAEAHERAAAYYAEAGDNAGLTMVLNNASASYIFLGRLEQALEALLDAVEASRAADDPRTAAYANASLGALYTRLGDPDTALDHIRLGCAQAHAVNDYFHEIWALTALGDALTARGDHHQALETLGEALLIADRIANHEGEAKARLRLGTVHLLLDDPTTAEDHLLRTLELWTDGHEPIEQARLHHALAVLADRQGQHPAAEHHRARATRLYRTIHAHPEADLAERGDPPRY